MNDRRKSLGAKITIISAALAFVLALLTLTISSILFARKMKEITFTLVTSAISTARTEIDYTVDDLAFQCNTFEAHGASESTEQITEWWEDDKQYDEDFAGVVMDGMMVWQSDNYPFDANADVTTGIHCVDGKLLSVYSRKNDFGATIVIGTDLCNTSLVDNIKSQTESESSIFVDDVRYNTTLIGNSGGRAVGEKMNPAIWAKVSKGETYQSDANIYGTNYFVEYTPLEDYTGKIVGAVFSGYPKTDFDDSFIQTFLTTMVIVLVISAVIIVLLVIILRKNVIYPINALMPVCRDIQELDLSKPNENFAFNDDEVGTLARELIESKNTINTYVRDMLGVLTAMADGDFSKKPNIEYKGDFVAVHDAFNSIHSGIGEIIAGVLKSSNQVTSGSGQIADGTQMLAEGTQRQATAAEELSSTVEDISAKVDKTAENAKRASSLSADCAAIMQEQTQQMSGLMEAMDTVEKKSQDVANVIKAIEDIAFQTNILALNASIEAARAGEVGKGFAVVASEVGNLAAKSAESAASSKAIIDSTIKAVDESTKIARDAAQAIENVTEKSKEASQLVREIAEDSDTQSAALKQATNGINDISTVIQQNSATAQQSAASCEELSSLAKILMQQVEKLVV